MQAPALKTVYRWHQWLGLGAGLFLILIGFSGAIAVFKEEIDWLATPPLRVPVASPAVAAPDIDALVASVRAAHPTAKLEALQLSSRAGYAHRAHVKAGGQGTLEVFLDPATGAVRGERTLGTGYTSTLQNFIRQFHVRLLLGAWGRVFVGAFGIVLALSCVTGLWIYRGWLRNLFRLRWRGASTRARWSDLHKTVGVWSLVFNLLIGATGAVLGLENLAGNICRHWLGQSPEPALPRATAPGPSLPVGELVAGARAAFPELRVQALIFPQKPGQPFVVRGNTSARLVARNMNYVALDPASGAVLAQVDGRTARGWERLYLTFDPLHFGYFGGYWTKIPWFILGLAPGVLSLSGFWLWWRRPRALDRPTASSPATARFAARTALIGGALAASGACVLAARATGEWSLSNRLLEHAFAKPIALALVAFPLTVPLAWLTHRWRAQPGPLIGIAAVWIGYYWLLVSLFQ
jgi:uncharacterized iron-regulated membrane protein